MGWSKTSVCISCKVEPCEVIDGWVSSLCSYCADHEAEREQKRREWSHYHPGTPCPKSELE